MVRYIKSEQTNLPVDIMLSFNLRTNELKFKEANNRKAHPVPLYGIMKCDATCISYLKISNQQFIILNNWISNNMKLIYFLEEGFIGFNEFLTLMFKGGEDPTEQQKEVQKKLIDIMRLK